MIVYIFGLYWDKEHKNGNCYLLEFSWLCPVVVCDDTVDGWNLAPPRSPRVL